MALPEDPPTFRQPSPAERPWRWRLEDATGAEVTLPADLQEYADQSFPSQGDAESWIGEAYGDLTTGGVVQVTLLEADRVVYGPMSLGA